MARQHENPIPDPPPFDMYGRPGRATERADKRSHVPEQPPPPILSDRIGQQQRPPRQSRAIVYLLALILLTLLVLTTSFIVVSMQTYEDAHPAVTIDFNRLSVSVNQYNGTQTAEHNSP